MELLEVCSHAFLLVYCFVEYTLLLFNADGYTGDLYVLIKLLLPGSIKRTYNLQSKTIIKVFSKIFDTDYEDMLEHLEQVKFN